MKRSQHRHRDRRSLRRQQFVSLLRSLKQLAAVHADNPFAISLIQSKDVIAAQFLLPGRTP